MLQQLKSFEPNRLDVDEVVSLSAYAKILRAEYEAQKVEVPEWLDPKMADLSKAIKKLYADRVAAELKETRARRLNLNTVQETKEDLDRRIAKLEQITP
jgi:hypothetical protein